MIWTCKVWDIFKNFKNLQNRSKLPRFMVPKETQEVNFSKKITKMIHPPLFNNARVTCKLHLSPLKLMSYSETYQTYQTYCQTYQ